jgi:8-oxo-dGTP pyrophosphatase MutT (NUDIX family)
MTLPYDEALREQIRDHLAGHDRRVVTDSTKRHAAVTVVLVDSEVGEDRIGPAPVDDWIAGRPMPDGGLDGRMVDVSGGAAFLLCRRASRLTSHAAQWALPGGRVDEGERAVDAALRELDEEVGIKLVDPTVGLTRRLSDSVRIRHHPGGDLGRGTARPPSRPGRGRGGLPSGAAPTATRGLAAIHHHSGKPTAGCANTVGKPPHPRTDRCRVTAATLAVPGRPPRPGRRAGATSLRLDVGAFGEKAYPTASFGENCAISGRLGMHSRRIGATSDWNNSRLRRCWLAVTPSASALRWITSCPSCSR